MTTLLPASSTRGPISSGTSRGTRAPSGPRELGFLAFVYIGYALTRVLASDALPPATERAQHLIQIEKPLGLAFEHPINDWIAGHDLLGTLAAFHYASAHYVVTTVVLVWLFFRRPSVYLVARRTLVIATSVALALYLLAPTAPPRLVGGFTDVLAQHSASGWWGGEASAPQGLGWMTNQLAAFPSMHAGWALWVALAVAASTTRLLPRALAWSHALLTALVVVGTGNHWTLDVVVGWALVAFVWKLVEPHRPPSAQISPPGRLRAHPDVERCTSHLTRAEGVAHPPSSSTTRERARKQQGGRQPSASRASAFRTRAGSVVVHIGGNEALRKEP